MPYLPYLVLNYFPLSWLTLFYLPCHALLVPVLPYFTLPCLTLRYLALPHFPLPCLDLPYTVLYYYTLPCLTLGYISYFTLPFLTLPCLTLLYLDLHNPTCLTLLYPTLPYPTLSYRSRVAQWLERPLRVREAGVRFPTAPGCSESVFLSDSFLLTCGGIESVAWHPKTVGRRSFCPSKTGNINSQAYICIHHRIQLAAGDMTMSGHNSAIGNNMAIIKLCWKDRVKSLGEGSNSANRGNRAIVSYLSTGPGNNKYVLRCAQKCTGRIWFHWGTLWSHPSLAES